MSATPDTVGAGPHGVMPSAVAGQFYPGDRDALTDTVESHLRGAPRYALEPKAIVAPHAGYLYSGPIAGSSYMQLAGKKVSRVVLVGPAHRVGFKGIAVPDVGAFETPLGQVPVDREAISALLTLPGVGAGNQPFLPEHSLDVHLPFLQRVLTPFKLVPMLVGDADPMLVDRALDLVWGGPETQIVVSSDLSHYHDYATAQRIDGVSSQAIELLRADVLTGQHACGHVAVNALLQRARRLNMRATAIDVRNSGDTQGARDRVVGYGGYAFETANEARLSDADRALLRETAMNSIRHGLKHGRPAPVDLARMPPSLRASRSCFVTLTLNGKLRGCIGSVQPHRPLAADVSENAFKAGFGDPRFAPLTDDQAAKCEFGISVLGPLRQISAGSEHEILDVLQPDIDGLVINANDKGATFLPKVWGNLPNPLDFLRSLKQKAGLDVMHWPDGARAFRFTTEDF